MRVGSPAGRPPLPLGRRPDVSAGASTLSSRGAPSRLALLLNLVTPRAGAKVRDSDSVYGGPAVSALLAAANLGSCSSIFEFGCGSGRLADRLLRRGELAPGARYIGVDASPVMAGLAERQLQVRLIWASTP
jgi:SAM-dependent methyltransferase